MDISPDGPDEAFVDETARFLAEIEREYEGYLAAGPEAPAMPVASPYASPDAVPFNGTPHDDLLDPTARLLDAFVLWQEAQVLPADGHEDDDQAPYTPEEQVYGSFDTRPPLISEPELRGTAPFPRRAEAERHRLGTRTGIRRGGADQSVTGPGSRPELWCPRKGDLVSAPHDECKDCDEDCAFAGCEAEDEESAMG